MVRSSLRINGRWESVQDPGFRERNQRQIRDLSVHKD